MFHLLLHVNSRCVQQTQEVAAAIKLIIARGNVVVATHGNLVLVELVLGVYSVRVGVRIKVNVKGLPVD